jgi:hypothetical protein
MAKYPETRQLPNLMGMDMEMIFYLCVTLVSDLNRDEYATCIFFHPQIIRRVPNTLLPL